MNTQSNKLVCAISIRAITNLVQKCTRHCRFDRNPDANIFLFAIDGFNIIAINIPSNPIFNASVQADVLFAENPTEMLRMYVNIHDFNAALAKVGHEAFDIDTLVAIAATADANTLNTFTVLEFCFEDWQ